MTYLGSAPAAPRGWHKRLKKPFACAIALFCCSLLSAGCAGGGADLSAPYAVAGLNASATSSAPGQAVSYGVPVAVHSGEITLESAALLPLPGYPFPQFVGIGLVRSKGWVTSAHGWPPVDHPRSNDPSYAETIKVDPLAGTVVRPGQPVAIYYAIRGARTGVTYYAAGIRLTYRDSSGEHAATLYQVGVDCVMPKSLAAKQLCPISAAANKAIMALA
jgi:hypothetical protein